ncbi:Subtilisin-like protease [Golovinomyces cichoracearum]|uniref:Subtilisin-like protease n=1 Tax=Golovinomyces cichoracearum TaxID=62708 RepID=A0A420J576_9PEZI|nr:Subtilisin-like protease [Golovinomyces cichoracearum]
MTIIKDIFYCKLCKCQREDIVVTVGATAFDDSRACFSNYGKCIDIFAPGLNIQSTWIGSKYAVKTISGNFMASAHVAGLMAYFLSLQPELGSDFAASSMTSSKMKELLVSVATKDAIPGLSEGTANLLAYNGGGSSDFPSFSASSIYQISVTDETSFKSDLNPSPMALSWKDALEKNVRAFIKNLENLLKLWQSRPI